ncbi:MAG: hypothetical protein N3E40_01535 [Dehalococcoidia bacterium]|nr:hypothetical protein [Dehalococcoidia bacterium]
MKVYSKLVLDIETGKVLEEESFEWDGPVAKCDFGGDVSAGYEALASAYREAAKVARQMFDLTARMGDPWRMAGQSALGELVSFMGLPYSVGPAIPYDVLAYTAEGKPRPPGPIYWGTGNGWGAPADWGTPADWGADWRSGFLRSGLGTMLGERLGSRLPGRFSQMVQGIVGRARTATGYDQTAKLKAWPGYQWALQQGIEALERSAAARGMGLSGAVLKGITNYAQQAAVERALAPYLNMLTNLSTGGLSAATNIGGQGIQTGQVIGQNLIGAGQAQLAGALAQAQQNASFWNSLLGTIGSIVGSIGGQILGGPIGGQIGSALLGSLGGGGGGFLPSTHVNTYIGMPSMADGGPVEPGKPHLVGEEGPEVFVPERPGFIIPNDELERMVERDKLLRQLDAIAASGRLRFRYHPDKSKEAE